MVETKLADGVSLTSRTSSSMGPQMVLSLLLSLVLMSKYALYGSRAEPRCVKRHGDPIT